MTWKSRETDESERKETVERTYRTEASWGKESTGTGKSSYRADGDGAKYGRVDATKGEKQKEGEQKAKNRFRGGAGWWEKIRGAFGMDKIFLILLAGVLLMLSSFPSGKNAGNGGDTGKESAEPGSGTAGGISDNGAEGRGTDNTATYAAELERRLETVLLSVEGVGQVKVMITLKDHGEHQLQSDTRREQSSTSETDSAGGSRSIVEGREELSTVILNDGSKSGPYVTREILPEIEGVVVVAQGAEKALVKTEIYEAVQVLFNVPAHKIKVLKGVLEN